MSFRSHKSGGIHQLIHKVINLANEVFGFSGWSSSIVSLVTDFVSLQCLHELTSQIDVNEQGRCSISVSAQVRITLRDGAFHEDIGSGQAENVRGKASALDKVSFQLSMIY